MRNSTLTYKACGELPGFEGNLQYFSLQLLVSIVMNLLRSARLKFEGYACLLKSVTVLRRTGRMVLIFREYIKYIHGTGAFLIMRRSILDPYWTLTVLFD